MQQLHHSVRQLILSVIDFFYPWFKKLMPLQTFRYAVCGGGNTCMDIGLFFISYNYVFHKQPIRLSFNAIGPHIITISPHIAAFLIGFTITFPIGFYLSRYVVFQEMSVGKREQLGRYFTVVLGCLILNYGFLKLFVDVFNFYATPSKILTTFFVIGFSYLTQKNYTFKAMQA